MQNYYNIQNQALKEQLIGTNINQKYQYKHQTYITTVEIKDYNVITDEQSFSDQPVKNDLRAYDNIRKIAIGQQNDYTTGCLLCYSYFKDYYKMIAIDLSKQKELDADPKAVEQINFRGNLN